MTEDLQPSVYFNLLKTYGPLLFLHDVIDPENGDSTSYVIVVIGMGTGNDPRFMIQEYDKNTVFTFYSRNILRAAAGIDPEKAKRPRIVHFKEKTNKKWIEFLLPRE
jgi:hypothetical protein